MHHWGDNGVDFKGIANAADWIGQQLVRWGRVNVTTTKEKFGTARVYCSFGWYQFHSITHPRHAYSQYPRWLWHLDCDYGNKICWLLNLLVVPYHRWLYRLVYRFALKKWPHLKREIIYGADKQELLKGLFDELK